MKKLSIFIGLMGLIGLIGPSKAYAASSFSLSPATASKTIGTTFAVDIILDTGGDAVSGATAIVNYDYAKLQVVDDDTVTNYPSCASGVNIKQGTIFNQGPLTNCADATIGQVRYDSGSLGASYTGRGVMATIHFKALAVGNAAVNYVFDPSSTINTSLVAAASGPTNLLTTTNGGTYTITSGSGGTLPDTGMWENTVTVVAGGVMLLGMGTLLRRKLAESTS